MDKIKANLVIFVQQNPDITHGEVQAIVDFLEWSIPKPKPTLTLLRGPS